MPVNNREREKERKREREKERKREREKERKREREKERKREREKERKREREIGTLLSVLLHSKLKSWKGKSLLIFCTVVLNDLAYYNTLQLHHRYQM